MQRGEKETEKVLFEFQIQGYAIVLGIRNDAPNLFAQHRIEFSKKFSQRNVQKRETCDSALRSKSKFKCIYKQAKCSC